MPDAISPSAISTDAAPTAIGPYSQGIAAGHLLFISGQIPIDPATGRLVKGTIEDRTRRVIENVRAIAQAAGAGLDQVVKTTIFLTDLAHFAAVNETYAQYFRQTPPARSTIQVAALPLGADIEMEAVVVRS